MNMPLLIFISVMVTMAHHTWHMIGLNKYLINIGHNGPASERVGTKVL